MSNQVYKKSNNKRTRKVIRFLGLGISVSGLLIGLYFFFPLISWEFYLKPVFASASYASPIPHSTILTKNSLKSLISNASSVLSGINYNNANNWLPPNYKEIKVAQIISTYLISVPKLKIENAIVSTIDTDLTSHLVHFPGTAIPPSRGTADIFGHSTLPQLFDKNNYKTIFANIHELKLGDVINVSTNNTLYTYKVYEIEITNPENTSFLTQNYDASYLYIVTCTPPGTTWKRLIVKSRLENS